MKTVWLIVLVVSSVLLGALVIKRNLPKGWLARFGAHLILAAMGIYLLNYSGWLTGLYIPLNPLTIGAVSLLGLPGIALIAGLQWTLLS